MDELTAKVKGIVLDVEPYSPFGAEKGRQLGYKVYEALLPPSEYADGVVRRLSALTRKKVVKA